MKRVLLVLALSACSSSRSGGLVPGDKLEAIASPSVDFACGMNDDTDGDGDIDVKWTYTYMEGGLIEHDEAREVNGTVTEIDDLQSDHAGNLVYFAYWSPTQSATFTDAYDTFGRRQSEVIVQTGDIAERWDTTYTAWNDAGSPLASSTTAQTAMGYTTSIAYDAEGRLTEVLDTYADQTIRYHKTVTYDDGAGTRTSTQTYEDGRQHTFVQTFEDGHVVLTYTPADPQTAGSTETLRWSGDRLLSVEDRDTDNRLFYRQQYLYDCQ